MERTLKSAFVQDDSKQPNGPKEMRMICKNREQNAKKKSHAFSVLAYRVEPSM